MLSLSPFSPRLLLVILPYGTGLVGHLRQGRDHLIVCAWWGAWRAWEQGSERKDESLWELLRGNAVLATYDEFFARDWNKV